MTDILRNAAAATSAAQLHVSNAKTALEEFRLLGINAAGVYMNPFSQLKDLQAARAELDLAIAIMSNVNWPSKDDYSAL